MDIELNTGSTERTQNQVENILIVDDNRDNRLLLHDFVISMKHQPILAENGKQALEIMRGHPIDLVLLDIMMPIMDGFQVLEILRSDKTLHGIPVIVISALDEINSVTRCIQLGAVDYLFKPFQPVLLEARINSSLMKKNQVQREKDLYHRLEESYQHLQKVEKARDSFVHMVVHDLKGPLTVIKGYTELLLMTSDKAGSIYQPLQNIYTGVNELHSLISSILDVSKLESGEMSLHPEQVDAAGFAETIYQSYKPQFDRDKIQFHFDCTTARDAKIQVDAGLLSRILQNIIVNALKYSSKGKEVFMKTTADDKFVTFMVKDSGPGIPKENLGRIFDKFFQADAKKTGGKYGVGLGLTFCQIAAEANGGKVWAESEGRGTGASFFIQFPRSGLED